MSSLPIVDTKERQLKKFGSIDFLVKEIEKKEYIVVDIAKEDYLRPNGKMRTCTGYSDKNNVGIYKNLDSCFKAMEQFHKRDQNYKKAISQLLKIKNEDNMLDFDSVVDILREFKNSEKELN